MVSLANHGSEAQHTPSFDSLWTSDKGRNDGSTNDD